MRTFSLLPSILMVTGVLATLPEPAEARPNHGQDRVGFNRERAFSSKNRVQGRANRNVPELSVGAAAAALGLLGGGLMVMTGRRRAKRS
jgi:hypothetical protein